MSGRALDEIDFEHAHGDSYNWDPSPGCIRMDNALQLIGDLTNSLYPADEARSDILRHVHR